MGGYGSGRPGGKPKAEHLRSVDVNRLYKAGHLQPGHRGGWQWTRDGEQMATIGTKGDAGRLTLNYRITPNGDEPFDVTEPVTIDWLTCHFGNARPFFICPGVINGRACNRRVAKLYLRQRYFLCRHCNRVTYACRSETPVDRMQRAANKRRVAMGAEPGMESYVRKPKGMHWATYWRHMEKIEAADYAANVAFMQFFQRRFSGMAAEILPL